jgi:hypothetical protein
LKNWQRLFASAFLPSQIAYPRINICRLGAGVQFGVLILSSGELRMPERQQMYGTAQTGDDAASDQRLGLGSGRDDKRNGTVALQFRRE